MPFFKTKKLLFFVLALSLTGLALKLLFVWGNSTAFTYDQGRDFLDLREMAVLGKLRLIGANTSLHGVFYGPFWYWAAFPFYLLTKGNPFSTLIPLLLLSFLMPLAFFLLTSDKRLGLILTAVYIFSYSFFTHTIVALNTNPMIFITPLFLLFLAKFYTKGKEVFLWSAIFLISVSFHLEPIIGLFGLPIFSLSVFFFKKVKLVLTKKRAFLAFFAPFLPQILFEFRHDFLQTRTVIALFSGKGSSLTPASGNLFYRFFDRLDVFKNVFLYQLAQNLFLAIILLILIGFLLIQLFSLKKLKEEHDFLTFLVLISLVIVFVGFVLYPYALWPWYLGTVDGLMVTLIGLAFYFLFKWKSRFLFLSMGLLLIFLLLNVFRYLPRSIEQTISDDPANLRTRLKVVNMIYDDSKGRGMNVFTFAPYVYDYPYQYLIWWRAKSKYQYLPEQYFYLPAQPKYVVAKKEADEMIPSKKSECDYLIIEPFESQEKWFWDWRYRFPEAQKTWNVGKTRIEKLCEDK